MEKLQGAKNILCVRLDNMGDVLMCSPALQAIDDSIEGIKLTMLVSPAGSKAARLIPAVDDIIEFDAPWVKSAPLAMDPGAVISMADVLKKRNFDASIIFTVYSQSPLPAAFLCFLAGIPVRVAHCRENPYQLLTHWEKEPEPDRIVRHEVRRQLDLVGLLGCKAKDEHISIYLSEKAKETARQIASGFRDPWYILHPGATAASRRYPLESFAKVIKGLDEIGWTAVISGTEEEKGYAMRLQELSGCNLINICGRLGLESLAALLSETPFLISNNTLLVHLAGGTKTPVVVLYALTNPQHTPWLVPCRVLFADTDCKYCYKSVCPEGHGKCLRDVEPGAIIKAVMGLLEETGKKALAFKTPRKTYFWKNINK